MAKSRSLTASIEFWVSCGLPLASTKPSSRATNLRSSGKVEPAFAPLPSGQTFTRLKLSFGDLPTDVVESFDVGHLFLPGEHGDFPEHRRMRDGAEDVLPPQPPVERNGLGETSDLGAGRAEKPSAA